MRRLSRLRRTTEIRRLFAETQLSVKNLIMPYFVISGKNKKEPINGLPQVYRLSIDNLIKEIKQIKQLGVLAVLLFGIAKTKDEEARESYSDTGILQEAIGAIKERVKDVVIITDVCLCGYTTHGHCGILKKSPQKNYGPRHKAGGQAWTMDHGLFDNDATLKVLAQIALSHANAGADFVAPSAMMDGQVAAIREILDKNNYTDIGILSYSAKYSSSFYGPFREALGSAPQFGNRKTYQMDFRNSDEALREIEQDINEGADIVMVKPALAYMDIIRRAKDKFKVPLAAYNVSGEYALIKEGAKKGIIDEKDAVTEILTAIKRSGADLIITYHAKEAAKWMKAVDGL